MSFLSGLEKFGLDQLDTTNLFEDDKKSRAEEIVEQKKREQEKKEQASNRQHTETEFLLSKTVRCPVCDQVFRTQMVKTGRVKRMEPDFDLRPRFEHIDTNKYDICSCPHCGYTAMHRYFPSLSPGKIKLLKENVQSKFSAGKPVDMEASLREYSYEEAIEYYKLGLYCSMVKKSPVSERAYACLKIAWLYRGWKEQMESTGVCEGESLSLAKEEEKEYYGQAYEGLQKAVATELFPICGMDEDTINILLASMAFQLEKYDVASKLVASVLVSKTAGTIAKNRARDIKEKIIMKLRQS